MSKGMVISGRGKNGFSMIEMMITVVIVSTCLLAIFRVFSICAAALSEAHGNVLAACILRDKMHKIREKSILEDGINVSLSSEEITSGNKKFKYTEDIAEFKEEASQSSEASEEKEGDEESFNLCRVKLNLTWKIGNKPRVLLLETVLPAKDFRHEF